MSEREVYEEMDVTDVLKLMTNNVEEIGWTKRAHMKMSKAHKKEAQVLLDIEKMLEKLGGFIEQKRTKVWKQAKSQYVGYQDVKQHFEDTSSTISNLQRDIKTLRTEAERKEKILKTSAMTMDTGVATANTVVVAKAKHGISLIDVEFPNNEEATQNKKAKPKKCGKKRPLPEPDQKVLKEKYIKCHKKAEARFRSTLQSATASLNAAKKIPTNFKGCAQCKSYGGNLVKPDNPVQTSTRPLRTERFKTINNQGTQTEVRFEAKMAATDNSTLLQKNIVERDDGISLQMAAADPFPEPEVHDSHWSFELTNVPTGARQMWEGPSEDLLSFTESEMDLPEIDLLAQGDFSRCLATVFYNNRPRPKDMEFTRKRGHVLEVPITLPGAVEDS